MPKKLKKKPLQKYQEGGDNPFAMFQGSGLDNPFASGINYNLFGQLQTTPLNQQFQNFSTDNFGQQIGQAATSTAKDLGQIPGFQGTFSGMPEWGGEYAQKMKQDVAKEKGLTYNSWTGKWKNDKGEVYTNKELEDLAGMRYDEQKATKERNQKLAPLAAPLLMLNELGEAQKRSYAQAQKESMYDVSRGPSAMESRGFFAKQGMRTPPVTEVYRMMGAHQGLPETSYKLASALNFKTAKKYEQGAYVKMLDSLLYEDGGGVDGGIKEDSVRNLTEEETNAFNSAKQRLVDYVNSPQWEDRFVKMQIPAADMNKARTKDLDKTIKEDMSIAREAILSNLDKSTPLIVSGQKIQNQAGMFDPDKGYIYINQDFSGPGEIQNVLLHELGHSATDPNTEYVARFVESVTKRGKEIDPQSMQKFFSSKGKPLTEMDIAYTMEKEIPVLVNTLRGKADEYGILRYGEDFTPAALNKLLEISNMSTGGTDPAADRDREFLKNQIQYLQSMLKGDENTLLQTLNTIAAADKKQQPMYYNAKNGARVSRLGMLLGSGLIRGYQEGGMQQPMSPEEEQMMMQAMQEQQAMQQQQQQPMPQQGGEMKQEGQEGQNKYMQLPPEQQAEVYKQIIDFILENGIDALEQQFPEEYQFFEEFSDKLEGEDMEEEGEGEQEGGGEMETEAGRMQMGGGEMEEEEMQSEYPTDEQEIPVGARPGENSMRPAQPMPGAQQMKEGGIPERYRKLGYTKVGQKRQSDRPGKKWAVLAKKGDQYKIVHGGAKGMDDFKQHGNKDRQKRFWDRMGGKDSAKANDPFSPLYWHKRFGTWILLSLIALI